MSQKGKRQAKKRVRGKEQGTRGRGKHNLIVHWGLDLVVGGEEVQVRGGEVIKKEKG